MTVSSCLYCERDGFVPPDTWKDEDLDSKPLVDMGTTREDLERGTRSEEDFQKAPPDQSRRIVNKWKKKP